MNMNKRLSRIVAAIVMALLLGTAFTGCGKTDAAPAPTEPAVPAEPAGSTEAEPAAERQDGERFEEVIILEGMEETVGYEHLRNDALGFEMDYDYERFERRSEGDRELFVSVWDDAEAPENYLEVKSIPRDAEAVADAVSQALSLSYEINRDDSFTLDRAGRCIRIDASADVGGLTMPDHLQMVYIIPAADGCRIATAHYAIEGAEGFGRRFHYLMESFTAIESRGEKRISDEQAVAAIKNYCCIQNPDLQGIADAEDYPVYWDIESSDGNQIVVVFRSYTGSLNRYYIDPVSGDTYVTEQVPGIIDEEQRTAESLNLWDYSF